MDFLVLAVGWVILFTLLFVVVMYGDTPTFRDGLIGRLRMIFIKVTLIFTPRWLGSSMKKFTHGICRTRNQLFQFVFLLLAVLGHAVAIFDILPLLFKYEAEKNHVYLPVTLAFINLYFYHMSCAEDPGEITPENHQKYSEIYKFDNRLYYPKTFCRTCNFMKPARSKHCSICDRCVYRFDHHCIWTNNDVGGLNARYFIMYLITLIIMTANGLYVGTHCLLMYVDDNNIMKASVLSDNGEVEPVTFQIAFQHLFMRFPRFVFLVVSLVVLIPMVSVFTLYHIFLIFTNQTTNERYKTSQLKDSEYNGTDNSKGRQLKSNNDIGSKTVSSRKSEMTSYRPYDNGTFSNILEVFMLHNLRYKNKKK